MRKFIVQVNGVQYDVEIEEIGGAQAAPAAPIPAAAPAATAPAPAAAAAPAQAAAAPAAPAAPAQSAPAAAPAQSAAGGVMGGETINAPLPGTVLDIKVSAGQNVKKGDILFVLEAMKMENEILAAHDGVIASVNVEKGAAVNSGDVLGSYK
ncbi:MAG TPA: biotin/lipoyl-binding protein [Firmicutes bacterium]|nr:biotin/lipoyl-binding protein [Bacillota bacterium]